MVRCDACSVMSTSVASQMGQSQETPPLAYVPCLRWKMGEYQALLRSTEDVLNALVPIIEIAEIGFDFERGAASKTIDEHLSPVAKRVHDKLGRRTCFIDMRHVNPNERMADGRHPAAFVFDGLREFSVPALPVVDLRQDAALSQALKDAADSDGRGVCLRVTLTEIAGTQFASQATELLERLGAPPGVCDLVLDCEAPNFEPIDGFSSLLKNLIGRLPHLSEWRTLTVLGTAFPATTAEVPRGVSIVKRQEWAAYKSLTAKLSASGLRVPRFGDYGVAHPALVLRDPRFTKPNATVRYTVDDGWLIAKGNNVRDYKFEQYRDLCKTVTVSSSFEGSAFSFGDRYIEACALGTESTGTLTTWRWVGTNHHLAKVVTDISTLGATSFSP